MVLRNDFVEKAKLLENATLKLLELQLANLQQGIEDCIQCAMEAPTLITPTERHFFAGKFYKRAINDLWAVWKLVSQGYTSQAAAVACSLIEHCVYSTLIIEDESIAQRIKTALLSPELDSFLPPTELFELYERKRGSWPHPVYKWLCKIKHPTLITIRRKANDFNTEEGKYIIGLSPNARADDLGNKRYVAVTSLHEMHVATWAFTENGHIDFSRQEVIEWKNKMDQILLTIEQELTLCNRQLSFNLSTTKFAQRNWKKVMR